MALIYKDQAFIAGEKGEYPEHLETYRTTRHELDLFIRPVKISDEPLLKDFFYALSDKSMYRRFLSIRRYIPHEELQKRFVVIDYTREMVILAIKTYLGHEVITGMGQYCIDPGSLSAECSVVVRDDFQNKGIGTELLSYLAYIAKKQGLLTFTAEILPDNTPVFRLLDRLFPNYEKKLSGRTCSIHVTL
jgi:GNAT superfamily N-acetyltransferase